MFEKMFLNKEQDLILSNEDHFCVLCFNQAMKKEKNPNPYTIINKLLKVNNKNTPKKMVYFYYKGLAMYICKECIRRLSNQMKDKNELLLDNLNKFVDLEEGEV